MAVYMKEFINAKNHRGKVKVLEVEMNCYKLNERVYNKCEQILEGQQREESVLGDAFYKSIYGPATLMNDWYESRVGKHLEIKSSEPPLSEHMDNFRLPCSNMFPDRREYFTKVFEGYGLGQELLLDHLGFSYYDNYVTSYDLMYNHLKKGICGPYPRNYFKGQYLPETDLTSTYGNLTQWGLKEKIFEGMKPKLCKENSFESETAAEYVPYDLHQVKQLNDFPNFKRPKTIY